MKPWLPVVRHGIDLSPAEIAGVISDMASDRVAEGPEQGAFEDDFARYHDRRFAVSFSSGRSALYAFIGSLGLPEKSEIIIPAYTFFTIPEVVKACGHTPVFAPCHPLNYALDPGKLETFITPRTAAVIVIHPFGQPAPMGELVAVASRRGLPVIEDPSQSIGARFKGRVAGCFGAGACFSLVHGKNMTAFGGGMLLTDDERIYSCALSMQTAAARPRPSTVRSAALGGLLQWFFTTRHGYLLGPFMPFYALSALDRGRLDRMFEEQREIFSPGSMSPLSNLQSALGRRQLARLDGLNAIRRRNAGLLLEGLKGVGRLRLPETVDGAEGTWNSFPVRVPRAVEFQRAMMLHGIDTRRDYMDICDFREEWASYGEVVYLPNHPGVAEEDVGRIVDRVREFMERAGDAK
jgi:dTDP-4-amino-4,6-dideoxygalactose transaminase